MKNIIIALAIGVLIGLGMGKAFLPPKVETKTVVQTVEKQVVKNNIITVTKEIDHKDGTKEIVVTETDKSQTQNDTSIVSQTEIKIDNKPQYRIDLDLKSDFREPIVYGVIVNKRLFGSVMIGLGVDTAKAGILQIGFEF
jgi:hypothetical protein